MANKRGEASGDTVLLSVIVPTFRRPEMLRVAIESVLANGFAGSMEVLVSDDDLQESARAVVEGWPGRSAAGLLVRSGVDLRYVVHAAPPASLSGRQAKGWDDGGAKKELKGEALKIAATDAGYPFQDKIGHVDMATCRKLPRVLALRYGIAPLCVKGGELQIAISNPYDFHSVDELEDLLRHRITCTVVPQSEVEAAIVRCYPEAEESMGIMQGHPAPNWDFAARLARGTYLFKLDDDDVILPGFLTRCVDFLEARPGVSCVYSAHAVVDMQTGARQELVDRVFFGNTETEEAGAGEDRGLVVDGARYTLGVLVNKGGYPVNHKTIGVCRRAAAERIEFYALAAEDFAMSAALGLTGDIGYIPEVLYEYRMHGANAMTTDLFRVWRFSRHALDGMEKLEAGLRHPLLGSRWVETLARCREALPLFYLYRAFRDQSSAAAWELWGKLRRAEAMRAEWKGWCLLLGGTVTPGFARTGLFEVYRKSGALRGWLRKALGLRPVTARLS